MRSDRFGKTTVTTQQQLLLLCLVTTMTIRTVQSLLPSQSSSSRRLGLLSFDLDDTLFRTGPVVKEANVAMLKRMAEFDCPTDESDFLRTTRMIRQGLEDPITYTELRKRAIRAEMERDANGKRAPPSDTIVDECFAVWLEERNAAAARHLLPDTVESLHKIRNMFPDACIGAITNGRGDPIQIDPLRPYFDFCVSGEDHDVFPQRKPQPGIYDKAFSVYNESHQQSNEACLWIHVGDCLANDVGASAACGALAVWYAPEEDNEDTAAARLSGIPGKQPAWSTALAKDLVERTRLAEKAQAEVSARIQSLSELPSAIERLLQASTAESTINL